jgi:hypothetical protein
MPGPPGMVARGCQRAPRGPVFCGRGTGLKPTTLAPVPPRRGPGPRRRIASRLSAGGRPQKRIAQASRFTPVRERTAAPIRSRSGAGILPHSHWCGIGGCGDGLVCSRRRPTGRGTTGSDHHGEGQPARADAVRRRATGADSVRVNTASPGSTGPAPCHRSPLECMVTDRGWRIEDKGCELGANRIPARVMGITNESASTVARPRVTSGNGMFSYSVGAINREGLGTRSSPHRTKILVYVCCGLCGLQVTPRDPQWQGFTMGTARRLHRT